MPSTSQEPPDQRTLDLRTHAFAQVVQHKVTAYFSCGTTELNSSAMPKNPKSRDALIVHTYAYDLINLDNAGDVIRCAHDHLSKIEITLIAHGTRIL